MNEQPADSVDLRVLVNWLLTRWNEGITHTTNWLRDEFETEVVKAIPSLVRMTTEVTSGVFTFSCETSDGGGIYVYGFTIDLFEDEDPDGGESVRVKKAA